MSDYGPLLQRVVQIGGHTRHSGVIAGEDSRRGAGHFHVPHLIRGIPAKGERRHVAILAANHLSKRIVGAVVGPGLPLAAEILQAEVAHLLATWIDIVLLGHQRTGAGDAHIVASITQGGAA